MEAISAIKLFSTVKSSVFSQDMKKSDLTVEICSPEEFHEILVREKERADRNGHGFSLVAVDTSREKDANSIVRQMRSSIRFTDEIGWFDKDTLGVFLYNTTAYGAWKFINNSRAQKEGCFAKCDYSVYSYPKTWCNL